MQKRMLSLILATIFVLIFIITGTGTSGNSLFDKIRPTGSDIPDGFIFGTIPSYAKKQLKDNPWEMDQTSIRKLANQIYPNGDYNKIAGIHVSIIAKKGTPFGDDIVCYIILFKNATFAREEIKKITEYANNNQDRIIVETKENLAVYLHVDDVRDYPLIKNMSEKIKERLNNIKI